MATRGEIRTRVNRILGDASDQKWETVQKNQAIEDAVLDSFPMAYDLAVVDGGTGFVTVSGTLDYTPTLTGITAEGVLRLELEPVSSLDPYTVLSNCEYVNVAGTPTIRLGKNPTGGYKLRATYRTAKATPTDDNSEIDLPENYVAFYAAFLLATAYLPKGASEAVQNYQKMAPVWERVGLRALRLQSTPPPPISVRRRRGV